MPFGSEIRLKIGADTTSAQAVFNKMPAQAAEAGKKTADAFEQATRGGSRGGGGGGSDNLGMLGRLILGAGGAAGAAYVVSKAVGLVSDYFGRQKTYAEDTERLTEATSASNRATQESIGGLQKKIELGQKASKQIDSDIARKTFQFSQMTGADAKFDPNNRDALGDAMANRFLNFVGTGHKEEVDKVKGSINELLLKQTQQLNANQLNTRELTRQRDVYIAQQDAISRISELQKTYAATEYFLAEVERDRLKARLTAEEKSGTPESQREARLALDAGQNHVDLAAIKRRDAFRDSVVESRQQGFELDREWKMLELQKDAVDKINEARRGGAATQANLAVIERDRAKLALESLRASPQASLSQIRQAETALSSAQGGVDAAGQSLRQGERDVLQDLTAQTAGGRRFANGARRPRSETERLASRAQYFRDRAHNAILTGASDDVGHFLGSAMADERTVGDRLIRGTLGAPKKDVSDAASMKPTLETAAQNLAAIRAALELIEVGN